MSEIVFSHGVRFPTGEISDIYKFSTIGSLNLVLGTCVTYERGNEVYNINKVARPLIFLTTITFT